MKTARNLCIAIVWAILHVHLSLFLAILMQEKHSGNSKEITEEEKQFTDLLFGDLEEVSIPVQEFGVNHNVETSSSQRRKAKGTRSLMARF